MTVADPDVVLAAVTVVGGPGTVAGTTLVEADDAEDVNNPLFAVTANVYAVPFVSPGTTHEVAGAFTVQVAPFGEAVTVYEEIAGPPVTVGAVKETVAEPLPDTAFTPVGASGLPAGVTGVDVAAVEVPVAFVAVALNVYAVPFVNPRITHDVAGEITVHVPGAGEAVTTKEVGAPPLLDAATVIVALPSPLAAETLLGEAGAAIVQTAVNVKLFAVIVYSAPAATGALPVFQPAKV